jgi:hypothetical protein
MMLHFKSRMKGVNLSCAISQKAGPFLIHPYNNPFHCLNFSNTISVSLGLMRYLNQNQLMLDMENGIITQWRNSVSNSGGLPWWYGCNLTGQRDGEK